LEALDSAFLFAALRVFFAGRKFNYSLGNAGFTVMGEGWLHLFFRGLEFCSVDLLRGVPRLSIPPPRRLEKGLGFPVAGRIEWTTGWRDLFAANIASPFFINRKDCHDIIPLPFGRPNCFPLFSTAEKQRGGKEKKGMMEWKRSFAWSPLLATGWRNSCYKMTERS